MFKVDLLSQAEDEMAEAYDWYEEQLVTLGNRFYNEVNYYLNLIENNPYQFPIRYPENLRSAALNKFPYLLLFWISEEDEIIYVISVFHTSRKPQY